MAHRDPQRSPDRLHPTVFADLRKILRRMADRWHAGNAAPWPRRDIETVLGLRRSNAQQATRWAVDRGLMNRTEVPTRSGRASLVAFTISDEGRRWIARDDARLRAAQRRRRLRNADDLIRVHFQKEDDDGEG